MNKEIKNFLDSLSVEKGFSPNTILAYQNDLNQFASFLKQRFLRKEGEVDWAWVNQEMIVSYILNLKEREYATATIARKVAAVRSFFDFLVKEGLLEKDPTENLAGPKLGKPLPKTLSPAQVEELLSQPTKYSSPEAKRDKAMLELLYATGMRVSELVSLNLSDVNLEEGFVRCFGKGRKERVIPIHEQAIRDLKTYLKKVRPQFNPPQTEEALFLNRWGQRLTRQGFWLILKGYAKQLGLEDKITPHTLRHSIATHLLHSGKMNLRELQEFLGHANISTTQVYTHLTSEHVRQVYERSHPRAK